MEKQRIEEIEDLAQRIVDLPPEEACELFAMLSEKYGEKADEANDADNEDARDGYMALGDAMEDASERAEEFADTQKS